MRARGVGQGGRGRAPRGERPAQDQEPADGDAFLSRAVPRPVRGRPPRRRVGGVRVRNRARVRDARGRGGPEVRTDVDRTSGDFGDARASAPPPPPPPLDAAGRVAARASGMRAVVAGGAARRAASMRHPRVGGQALSAGRESLRGGASRRRHRARAGPSGMPRARRRGRRRTRRRRSSVFSAAGGGEAGSSARAAPRAVPRGDGRRAHLHRRWRSPSRTRSRAQGRSWSSSSRRRRGGGRRGGGGPASSGGVLEGRARGRPGPSSVGSRAALREQVDLEARWRTPWGR